MKTFYASSPRRSTVALSGAADADHTGRQFWLSKLGEFGGDYVAAEMVKAFITSDEHRQRFGR